jgi:hypothetical protein
MATDSPVDDLVISNGRTISAFEVHQNRKGKHKGKGTKEKHKGIDPTVCGINPIKLLQDVAKRFGVKTLVKRYV